MNFLYSHISITGKGKIADKQDLCQSNFPIFFQSGIFQTVKLLSQQDVFRTLLCFMNKKEGTSFDILNVSYQKGAEDRLTDDRFFKEVSPNSTIGCVYTLPCEILKKNMQKFLSITL